MRTSIIGMGLGGLLALAACGGPDKGEGNEAAGDEAAPASGVKLQPGEWEITMETVSVTAPGLPPSVAATIKKPRATNRTCMTPEEANGPKPDMFAGSGGVNCKQEGFSWTGGRIKGTTTCQGAGGTGKTVMAMDGQYGAQSMDMNMKMTTDAAGTPMTVETRMTGRRVGDCPAGKAG
jgi:uncharacterized protein DUF3617